MPRSRMVLVIFSSATLGLWEKASFLVVYTFERRHLFPLNVARELRYH